MQESSEYSRSVINLTKPAGKSYITKRGYVRLAYTGPVGRLWNRMLKGKGAIFGDLPFRPRLFVGKEQAVASGMACVIKVPRAEIEAAELSTPHFQSLLVQTLSSQVTALDRRLQWQLLHFFSYLKEEKRILSSRLPKQVNVTAKERQRLVEVGKKLGAQLKELISIAGKPPRSS